MVSKMSNQTQNDQAIVENNYIKINYTYNTILRTIFLPYTDKISASFKRLKFILIKLENGIVTEYDITHQAGIPYLLSADKLGGEKIEVRKIDGTCIKVYEKGQIPDIKEINC